MEWVRFIAAVICLAFAAVMEIIAIYGVYRFRFVMNRMHAAAIGDTLALLLGALGLVILKGLSWFSLKMVLVVILLWMTSSISSHVIMRMELCIDEESIDLERIDM
ncbi:MAG: monovalent cation/H(+) antiporter subunit G [Lachnospiraceae bacterium]|nr:monovalent cation/H(+) antiporter subunit G [Lachnospiraceae bacterium]MBR6486010.1 monovalent cation/H(+) antiporter subunit G [Lachnospiraceae bacterium]